MPWGEPIISNSCCAAAAAAECVGGEAAAALPAKEDHGATSCPSPYEKLRDGVASDAKPGKNAPRGDAPRVAE